MSLEAIKHLPEDQLVLKAVEALMSALGPVEATRFLSLARMGRVESVHRHREWQESYDRETLYDQVFKNGDV